MKTSTRIISLLATAVVGLTLTSCGGGGGGGGGNGGGATGSSGGSSANTGLAPASLAGQQWIFDYASMSLITFTFVSDNKVIIQTNFRYNGTVYSNEKTTVGTYTYEPNGDKAVLKITGTIYKVEKAQFGGSNTNPQNIITWGSSTGTKTFSLNFYSKFGAYWGTSSSTFTYYQG